MNNEIQLPDLTPYLGLLLAAAAILLLIWFPLIAALVAPDSRRLEFFLLTLLVLWGPIGVACAAVANPRNSHDEHAACSPTDGRVRVGAVDQDER
jgi:hypothetical protein